jgi:2-dehydropantoate 2-reductase
VKLLKKIFLNFIRVKIKDKNKVKICVLGSGGIGGLLAVLLSKKNYDVVCSNGKIENKKVNFNLKSKFFGNKKSKVTFQKKNLKFFDIVFVCVKYQHLKSAMKNVDSKSNKLIVPLLNGLKHFQILKKKYGKNVITANIGKTVSFKKPQNIIVHKSKNEPEISLSSKNLKLFKILKRILKSIDIKVKVYKSDNPVIWTKLVRINALSSITALYNSNLGKIRKSKEKKKQLISILKETIRLANYKGVKIKYNDIIKEINSFPNNLTTSMQRDISNNNQSEIDTIIGGVLNEAKKENLILKTNQTVYKLLKNK